MTDSIAENIAAIRADIAAACDAAGRDPADVKLIAVSKKQPMERIEAALAAGHRVFGENRVQEAQARWLESGLRDRYPDIELHLIGPLQTNKAKDAVALFDVIQTVDREKLAAKLADEMARQNRQPALLVQVNTGDEDQKAGVAPERLAALLQFMQQAHGLKPAGLMCIPPVNEEAGLHFALLANMAAARGLAGLSMGMSGDYQKAIGYGASMVRVGSALFGARPAPEQ